MATRGEAKLINPITLENIADAIIQDGLASLREIDALTQELYAFAADPRTVTGLARVIGGRGVLVRTGYGLTEQSRPDCAVSIDTCWTGELASSGRNE